MSSNSDNIRGKEPNVTKCHKSTHSFDGNIEIITNTNSVLNNVNNIGQKQHCHTAVEDIETYGCGNIEIETNTNSVLNSVDDIGEKQQSDGCGRQN